MGTQATPEKGLVHHLLPLLVVDSDFNVYFFPHCCVELSFLIHRVTGLCYSFGKIWSSGAHVCGASIIVGVVAHVALIASLQVFDLTS